MIPTRGADTCPNAGYVIGKETAVWAHGSERDAPIPDLPAGRQWNIKFEEMGPVDYAVDLHRMTALNVSIPS